MDFKLVIEKIISEYGNSVLNDPKRFYNIFSDYASSSMKKEKKIIKSISETDVLKNIYKIINIPSENQYIELLKIKKYLEDELISEDVIILLLNTFASVYKMPLIEEDTSQPTQQTQPILNSQPIQQSQPILNSQPIQQTQPILNSQPIQQTQPILNSQPIQQTQPILNPQPTQQTQPILNPQPTQQTQPIPNPQQQDITEAEKPKKRGFPFGIVLVAIALCCGGYYYFFGGNNNNIIENVNLNVTSEDTTTIEVTTITENNENSNDSELEEKYLLAKQSLGEGKYDVAIELFNNLGDYKDATVQIKDAKYKKAIDLANSGNYKSAITILEEIEGYGDTNDKILEIKYSQGCDYYNQGKYDEAIDIFSNISDYNDASIMLKDCKYSKGVELMNLGKYDEASKIFSELGTYSNSMDLLDQIYNIQNGDNNMNAGIDKPNQETSSSRYEIIAQDCTWEEAKSYCEAKGGHLATFENEDEYQEIFALAKNSELKYIWIGGTSDPVGSAVYVNWIDGSDATYLSQCNHWFYDAEHDIQEPSGYDRNTGDIECYLMLWYTKGEWGLCDNSDLAYKLYKNKGIMGYVCQYD